MEIADSLVPITAVSYQKFIFLTVTQLAEVTTVKITVYIFVGQTVCVTAKFHYSGRQ